MIGTLFIVGGYGLLIWQAGWLGVAVGCAHLAVLAGAALVR